MSKPFTDSQITLLEAIYTEEIDRYLGRLFFRSQLFTPGLNYSCPFEEVIPQGHLTIDYIGALLGNSFILFSFLLAIVEKIMCNLRLTVDFVSIPEGYYLHKTLLLDPIFLDPLGTQYGDIVATQQVYMVEVMTTYTKEPFHYFSFFYLFKLKIWICLLLSAIINVIFWNMTNERQVDLSTGVGIVLRSLVSQPINHIKLLIKNHSRNCERRKKKIIFLMLFANWLMIGGILQKCICSVLLNSYLESKPVPLFKDLASIELDKKIKIAGQGSIQYLPNSTFSNVEAKFLNDSDFPISTDRFGILETLNMVINGKAVILDHSYGMENKEKLFQEFDDWVVLEEKYAPTYVTFFVNNRVEFKGQIMRLIRRGMETGLYWHYRMIEVLKIEVWRRVIKHHSQQNHLDSIVPYSSLIKTYSADYALRLDDIWPSVILVQMIGYVTTLFIFISEIVYHRYFHNAIEEKVQGVLKLHSAKHSILHKLLNNRKPFVKRARRLKSLSFQPKQVHQKLRSNYRLYFEKY